MSIFFFFWEQVLAKKRAQILGTFLEKCVDSFVKILLSRISPKMWRNASNRWKWYNTLIYYSKVFLFFNKLKFRGIYPEKERNAWKKNFKKTFHAFLWKNAQNQRAGNVRKRPFSAPKKKNGHIHVYIIYIPKSRKKN